jgi:hypothetical protein
MKKENPKNGNKEFGKKKNPKQFIEGADETKAFKKTRKKPKYKNDWFKSDDE